jgi:hypothetical protein
VERSLNRLLHLLPATKCVVACVSAFQNDESFWGDETGKIPPEQSHQVKKKIDKIKK